MKLRELEIYQIARTISAKAWEIYGKMDWQNKKIMGDQWISSIDSIGANIAEGFGRYHYLDKNKFSYNARASLLESIHWTELLEERQKISSELSEWLKTQLKELHVKLNNYIKITRTQVQK